MMIELMKGVVQSGTGVRLNYKYRLNEFSNAIAGKTGTTQNNSDCWFVGITPTLPQPSGLAARCAASTSAT